ncbi:MAG: pentapeptide repeat-containing protein [Planctomycetes bacterium]|nr:pentapeptide repeat-containing protein [Planctomycetota bacterium]
MDLLLVDPHEMPVQPPRRIRTRFLVGLGIAIVAAVLVLWVGGPAWDRIWMRIQLSFNGTLRRYRARPLADLGGMILSGCDLREARFPGASFRGADLGQADLQAAELANAVLEGVNLAGADLRGADLQGANLRGANLRDADLRGADLRTADLGGAELEGCRLANVADAGADADALPADLLGATVVAATGVPWEDVLHSRNWDLAVYSTDQVHTLFDRSALPSPPHFENWDALFDRNRPRGPDGTKDDRLLAPALPRARSIDEEGESAPVRASHREGEGEGDVEDLKPSPAAAE